MSKHERLGSILELLNRDGTLDVDDAAAELHVSAATIRRDLDILAQQQLLTRTHGGAVSNNAAFDLPLRYKTARYASEKQRIGRAAAEMVSAGTIVGLNGGTTTTEVARALALRGDLQSSYNPAITVVTNSLNIASELAVRPNLKLVVTGGVARAESYELVGPFSEAALSALNLDVAIIGVDGISVDAGLTTHHEVEAHTNRAMTLRAHSVIVVADSSKVGQIAFARICELDRVDELISDVGADPDAVSAIRDAGVEVTLV